MGGRLQQELDKHYRAWLDDWLVQDFSWSSLAKKKSWLQREGVDQQAYIRKLEGDEQDANLLSKGRLVDVPNLGLYHIAFIPPEWAKSDDFPLTIEELQDGQRAFWNRLFGNEFRDTYAGTITGVHPPEDISQRLITETRASFEWCSISSPRLAVASRGGRKFKYCAFLVPMKMTGDYSASERKPWLDIISSALIGELEVTSLKGVSRISFEDCKAGIVEMSHTEIDQLIIDGSEMTKLSLWDATFGSKVLVRECEFPAGIEFSSSRFADDVEFIETHISNSVDLIRCDFAERVTFADVSWPEVGYLVATLSGSRFKGLLTFSSSFPPPIQIFREANFEGGLGIGRYTTGQWREMLEAELDAWAHPHSEIGDKLSHCENIESACRNVRKLVESEGNVHAEHFWHRSELIARRSRGDLGRLESSFSQLYGLVADYGLSIARPFSSLAVVTGIFWICYLMIGAERLWGGRIDLHNLQESLGFSLNRTLPIGVFGNDDNAWRRELMGSGGTFASIGVRVLATAQTIISAVLIYLGVMAVRRKFKIS